MDTFFIVFHVILTSSDRERRSKRLDTWLRKHIDVEQIREMSNRCYGTVQLTVAKVVTTSMTSGCVWLWLQQSLRGFRF